MNPNKPLLIATRTKLAELHALQVATKLALHLPHDANSGYLQYNACARAIEISCLLDLVHELCARPLHHGSKPEARAWHRARLEKALVVTSE